jgi:hypothetical protein
LWTPFILINLGCTMRVVFQVLTDITPYAFPFAGISGVLEVAGLAIWGIHIWRIMRNGALGDNAPRRSATPLVEGAAITLNDRVGDVLETHPHLLNTFLSFGFRPLANPWLRKTLARSVTLEHACRLLGIDTQDFLDALNAGRVKYSAGKYSLPVPAADSDKPAEGEGTSCLASSAH